MYHNIWAMSSHWPIKHKKGSRTRLSCGPAVSVMAAKPNARIGPQCKCTDLADWFGLAHSGLKALLGNISHGPISCTSIFGQLARIGPSSTKRAAARGCRAGLQLV